MEPLYCERWKPSEEKAEALSLASQQRQVHPSEWELEQKRRAELESPHPASVFFTEQKQSLLELPLDVVRLVLESLDEDDLSRFRLVSRACRRLSEPIMFRSLRLQVSKEEWEDAFAHLVVRLCDPEDDLRYHVRHLKIGPALRRRSVFISTTLPKLLLNLDHLQDLTWYMIEPMQTGVFVAFTKKWPKARLHVKNFIRNDNRQVGEYVPMDTRLLSSKQLYSLHYVLYLPDHDVESVIPPTLEYSVLESCLSQATSLKRLCLLERFLPVGNSKSLMAEDYTSMYDCLQEGKDFSDGKEHCKPLALEELSVFPRLGLSQAANDVCRRWLAGMDLTKLRHLSLGSECAPRHFTVLTGKVPKLESLTCDLLEPNINGLAAFLSSFEGLVALEMTGTTDSFLGIEAAVWENHGSSLRKLKIHNKPEEDYGWGVAHEPQLEFGQPLLRNLVRNFPNLEDLKIQVEMEFSREHLDRGYDRWPQTCIDEVVKLSHLQHLQLDFALPEYRAGTNHYHIELVSVHPNGDVILRETAVRGRLCSLFERLRSKPHSQIKTVTARFVPEFRNNLSFSFTVMQQDGAKGRSDYVVLVPKTMMWKVEPFRVP